MAEETVARSALPRARRLVQCINCTSHYPEGSAHSCLTQRASTGELAPINVKKLTDRQWAGIDCVLCSLALRDPAGTGAKALGQVLDSYGHRFTLWAHDPPCVSPR